MLNTYIKNRGTTKTIIHDNNHNHVNQLNWDADYDGDIANISIDSNTDGKRNHYAVSLDNEDLANILTMPSVDMSLDKRLKMDFQQPYYTPENYFIEIPTPEFQPRKSKYLESIVNRHISSPSSHEELVIPLTINPKGKNLFTLTPHKKHKRAKTHITHRVYKRPKSTSRKTKSRSKSRSSSKKTIPIMDLL
jgi:hypothetical protein